MLTSITLQNFKSFGEERTIPLQHITVLVGPNNSGKSNLVSLARFIRNAAESGQAAFQQEGGVDFVFHRPCPSEGTMRIAWKVGGEANGSYVTELSRWGVQVSATLERFEARGQNPATTEKNPNPFNLLRYYSERRLPDSTAFRDICMPMVGSRDIKLATPALRQDAVVIPDPQLGSDGAGMAAVLGLWRGAKLDRAEQLDEFVSTCLPEIKRVLAKPAPIPGEQRTWIQQVDGEQFDAAHISDGVLSFIALAMYAIDAEPGSLLFIEEPEQCIHPRRICSLVELFRKIVYERKCQVVIATHSPVLLHEFRNDPEAILLFRRGETGTRVDPLTHFPHLMEAIDTRGADPGDMLVDGFLNEPS